MALLSANGVCSNTIIITFLSDWLAGNDKREFFCVYVVSYTGA